MDVRHTLICFFFLSGNTGLITEGIRIITGKEGGTIRHECTFFFSGSQRAFYKGNKLLIGTEEDKAQYDRYSIEYKPAANVISDTSLYVSITNLTKSDSGNYRCVLDGWLKDSVEEFELRVEDAPTTLKPNWTPGPFPTSVPSTSTPTTAQTPAARPAGNTGLITEGIPIITGKEGGTIRHECKFFFFGSQRAFYKENKLLIETYKDKAQYDRYSIEYKPAANLISDSYLYVSITNLTKSDSGLYRCVLDGWLKDSVEEFELRVEDASTTLKPNWTPGPFPTSVPSTSTPTTAQSLTSSSGSATPSSTQTPAARPGTLLSVRLTLFIMISILSAAVLIYCRKTGCKPKGPPQEAERVSVTEAGRVYEEIREEDRQSRSPPVQISAVHAHAKYTRPNAAEGTD